MSEERGKKAAAFGSRLTSESLFRGKFTRLWETRRRAGFSKEASGTNLYVQSAPRNSGGLYVTINPLACEATKKQTNKNELRWRILRHGLQRTHLNYKCVFVLLNVLAKSSSFRLRCAVTDRMAVQSFTVQP